MSSDLVEALRDNDTPLGYAAADEIERLQSQIVESEKQGDILSDLLSDERQEKYQLDIRLDEERGKRHMEAAKYLSEISAYKGIEADLQSRLIKGHKAIAEILRRDELMHAWDLARQAQECLGVSVGLGEDELSVEEERA